jgi:phage-related protein (TIGR01555 family)
MSIADNHETLLDAYASPNGAGGAYDKRTSYLLAGGHLSPLAAAAMYAASDVAQTVVDLPVREALREGWEIDIKNSDGEEEEGAGEAVMADLEDLRIHEVVADAARKARALGGAGIYLQSNDADPAKPWSPSSKLTGLLVLAPNELVALTEYVASPESPAFGLPAFYQLQPLGLVGAVVQRIHHSRVVRCAPSPLIRTEIQSRLGWGQSVLEPCASVIKDFEIAYSEAVGLIPDFAQGTISLVGLNRSLAETDGAGARAIATRFRLIDAARSLHRPLPLDAGDGASIPAETYERHPTPVAGLADVLDRAANRLSVATRIPVSVMLGQQPSGLGQTGDSSMRGFYDLVSTVQDGTVRPIIEGILQAYWGPREPAKWGIEFKPLWQPTEAEEAHTFLEKTQAWCALFDAGSVSADEVRAELAPSLPVADGPGPEIDAPAGAPVLVGGQTADIQATVLNGAQISSAVDIVTKVHAGQLAHESGVAMLVHFFQLSPEVASDVIGPKPAKPAIEPAPVAPGAPAAPKPEPAP